MTYRPLRVISDLRRTSLLHPEFPYIPAARTNVAETFARVRAAQQQGQTADVRPIKRRAR